MLPGWSTAVDGALVGPGEVAEVDADRASALVARGVAEEVRPRGKMAKASTSPPLPEAGR
jgi:hypothetical protein